MPPNIDPLLSLAYAIHSGPRRYALFLGSGVSKAAGIPTGWDIVADLAGKLAALCTKAEVVDPTAWYRQEFGHDPEYSKILEALGKTPAERQQILRSYFEPTEEEREQGQKVPTPAHRAIAKMARDALIKVIITTNFDHLLEHAMQDLGEEPTVISTPDAVEGALPIIHSKTTIIKVHGDYLDTRIRNTADELSTYDERMNSLLERVFEEFGLIVSGWSGDWDLAIRTLLEKRRNRRFSTYWTARGRLSPVAENLSSFLRAEVITVESADAFFTTLQEKTRAIQDLAQPHPLSAKAAVAALKRYLPDEGSRIKLTDLVNGEIASAVTKLKDPTLHDANTSFTEVEFHRRLARFENGVESLRALFAVGLYWDNPSHRRLWTDAVTSVAGIATQMGGTTGWIVLRRYPALLLLYAGGLTALAAEKYEALAELLTRPRYDHGDRKELVLNIHPYAIIQDGAERHLPGIAANRKTPISEYLHIVLRPSLRECLPDDERYDFAFDYFEYLFALIYADQRYPEIQAGSDFFWAPIGRFCWRHHEEMVSNFSAQIDATGESFPLLKVGFFGGNMERLKAVKNGVDSFANRILHLRY